MKASTTAQLSAKHRLLALCSLIFGLSFYPPPTLAQSVTASPDGTGTIIQHNGNTYTITGGTQAGQNLFHSFAEFGLSPTEIADFLANPQILNILGRVTSGNASIIDGLLQVSHSNANLYLMNPAGIVFGNNARLDVPGSFFATTADAIGFDTGYFTATGPVDYGSLSGFPNQFIFASGQGGTIINAANLSLTEGNTLGFIGGSVINTGTLSAPNGNITLTAVPENRTVRINQEGMILGLEVPQSALDSGVSALDLPELLVGQADTNITVDGSRTHLSDSQAAFEVTGNVVIAGQVSGETVNLAAANSVLPLGNPESLIRTHNGLLSAPTVTRFAQNTSDSNVYTFLDATIPDYNDLLYNGAPGTTTVVVTPTENGITKITDTLTTPGLTPVDAVHIVSEGSEGNFWLGNAFVNGDNISQYQSSLQQWSQGLSTGADILLYACLTAAGSVGEALLNDMARYTGADVAGSTNLTGAGGDWLLERNLGSIEADAPFESSILGNYRHSLQIFTVTNGGDGGTLAAPDAGTLRAAIADANVATVDAFDEIRFANGITQVTLTLGQLDIDVTANGLAIDGDANGAANVTVERDGGAGNFRIFEITGNNDVTIDALTIRNGSVVGNGGGISNTGTGTLALNNSTVSGNTITKVNPQNIYNGGGIFSRGNVILSDSTVTGNTATAADRGGGIWSGGAVTATNSTISGNSAGTYGGGIRSYGDVTATNSTISGNSAGTYGGGIWSLGDVTATNSTISGNSAGTSGGGIWSGGTVTATNSTISGNSAGTSGGGIYSGGTVTATNSTISGNSAGTSGGGIWSNGDVTATNSTISSNTAGTYGGGIRSNGDVTATNSTISSNTAGTYGGGIRSDGDVTATNSTISGNSAGTYGGGIWSNGDVTATNSTISGNSAGTSGGGIASGVAVNVTNSTISGNSAGTSGGGIWSRGGTITNSTITNNTADSDANGTGDGGGIYAYDGTLTIRNSIIAGNFDNSPAGNNIHPDVSTRNNGNTNGIINGNANNLIGNPTGANGTIGTGSDLTFANLGITDINQVLAPLANNGGTTQTHALVPGSPAINAGNNANAPAGNDQRGATRIFNNTVDIGAYESQGFILQPTNTPQSTTVNTAFANPLTVQLTDAFANTPIVGAAFTFTVPNSGATAILGSTTVFTDASGFASNPVTANTVAGNYQVNATATGVQAASFDLTNTPDNPATITVLSGNNQTAIVSTPFANTLQVQVRDQFGNLVPNATITFLAPDSGASGIATNMTVTTDADGIAQTTFTANAIAGEYRIKITANDQASATINLINDNNNNLCPPQCEAKNELSAEEEEAVVAALTQWRNQISDPVLAEAESIDSKVSQEYADYLGLDEAPEFTLAQAQGILQTIATQTGETPALLYLTFSPGSILSEPQDNSSNNQKTHSNTTPQNREIWHWQSQESLLAQNETAVSTSAQDSDTLDLILVTATGELVRIPVRGATRAQVMRQANLFRRNLVRPSRPTAYRESGQQLYEWLIAPLEAELEARGITNIAFIADAGLRSLPMAALYDGEQFLIERYSVGMMPSLALTDTRYRDVRGLPMLALGAERFNELDPLPAVPVELGLIGGSLWPEAEVLLNEDFTIADLTAARAENTYGIVHLATHAEFKRGDLSQSYIQFWGDTRLSLDQLRQLRLNDLPVELLVLSACRTALGSLEAELGFTGLAVQAGVKSALGSLWYVDDVGTLMLMSEFYAQLRVQTTKAEALRQAQLALLRGEVRLEGNQLVGSWGSLPVGNAFGDGTLDFSHPYFWGAFTLVGSPW
jgi:filamentous hemagglutinin family protein